MSVTELIQDDLGCLLDAYGVGDLMCRNNMTIYQNACDIVVKRMNEFKEEMVWEARTESSSR